MSVLLNITMPKTCEVCPCNDDNWRCGATGEYFDYDDMYERRRDDCPLVELPPHGRLIAEKTITEIRYHDADGYHIVNGEQLCELEIDADTVIEAEGSDG